MGSMYCGTDRRAILRLVGLAPFAAIAGCAGITSAFTNLSTVTSDAQLVANGLTAIGGVGGLSTAVVGKIQAYAARAQAAAQALIGAVTTAGAAPSVASIEAAVNGVVATLAGLPIPAPYSTYLVAAEALLPLIEAAVGMAARSALASQGMSADQARATLRRA